MDKLELRYIAPYLPYGLKCEQYGEAIGLRDWLGWGMEFKDKTGCVIVPLCAVKPILRPLSALTAEELKEINHCRHDEFHIAHMYGGEVVFDCENGDAYGATELPYDVVEKLLEWHYDIFNLIGRNLAIDATKVEGNS